jgi:predicted nucleotidyltransferase
LQKAGAKTPAFFVLGERRIVMALAAGNLSRERALSLTERFLTERFADADFAFVAGSIMRGTGTPSSDIDLVVLHSALPHAHRRSEVFEGVPFEALVHDEGTLHWFLEADVKAGRPVLIRMVIEGIPVGPRPRRADELRREAEALLVKGPQQLDQDALDRMRYTISSLLTDLADERPDFDRVAIGSALYQALGDFILRSNGQWSGAGKWLPRQMTAFDPCWAMHSSRPSTCCFAKERLSWSWIARNKSSPHMGDCCSMAIAPTRCPNGVNEGRSAG